MHTGMLTDIIVPSTVQALYPGLTDLPGTRQELHALVRKLRNISSGEDYKLCDSTKPYSDKCCRDTFSCRWFRVWDSEP